MCNKGFYLSPENDCHKCTDDCLDCVSSSKCIECAKENTIIIKGKCFCAKGFYGQYPLINNDCQKCPDDCEECSSYPFV